MMASAPAVAPAVVPAVVPAAPAVDAFGMDPVSRSGQVGLEDYRDLMSAFPTGVAVVTATEPTGRPHGLTCTSLTSVTLSPPTLLVCLDLRSATLAATRQCGCFAVNLLHARGRRAAEVFSSPVPDRFSQVAWRPSRWTRQPWLCDDSFAVAECMVVDASVVGDHAVVYGEVVHVELMADVPLLYGMRRFGCWTSAPGEQVEGARA